MHNVRVLAHFARGILGKVASVVAALIGVITSGIYVAIAAKAVILSHPPQADPAISRVLAHH